MKTKVLGKILNKKRRILMVFFPSLLLVAIFLLSGPVIVQTYLFADVFGNLSDPPVTIMNPFRDKEPERVANTFLNQLQNAEPASLLRPVIKDETTFEHICLSEKAHRLKSWNNYTREDTEEGIHLIYWPKRENYNSEGFAPPIIITVTKVGGDQKVISYSAGY